MEISDVKNFFGVPVLVQLRFAIAGVTVRSKGKIPYANDTEHSHWVPEVAIIKSSPEDSGSPEGTQLLACAVIQKPEGAAPSVVEVFWSSIPAMNGIVATLGTLLDTKDILSITRVVRAKEPSLLIAP